MFAVVFRVLAEEQLFSSVVTSCGAIRAGVGLIDNPGRALPITQQKVSIEI